MFDCFMNFLNSLEDFIIGSFAVCAIVDSLASCRISLITSEPFDIRRRAFQGAWLVSSEASPANESTEQADSEHASVEELV